jgi:hypothetical protein
MDFHVRGKDGHEAVIPGWGNLPVELMAAVAGVKPVVHAWVDEKEMPAIEKMADVLGLKTFVYSKGGVGSGTARWGVMIGADRAKLEACGAAWDKPMNNPGEHLGYPSCCVKAFQSWIPNYRAGAADCVALALSATKKSASLPWLLNDAYYLYSRPWSQSDVERREGMVRANPDWPMDILNVNAWHPCSYACKESKAKAEKTFAALKLHLPALAAKIRTALTHPVVFWDWWRFAALEGKPDAKGAVSYERIAPPFALLEPELRGLLDFGDRIAPGPEGLLVWKGRKKVGLLPGNPILLPFSA